MDVKTGTHTWTTAAQTSSLKPDSQHNLSAEEMKQFGNQAIGDVANRIVDPNWVDPTKIRKVGNNSLDKNAFLKLMLAQMKNQDPTSPMKSYEMAAQLAQFTSLEQLYNINDTLKGMKKGEAPVTNFQALNFIGKFVSGDSAHLTRAAGDTSHDFTFDLPLPVADATVKVRGSHGEIVRTYKLKKLDRGEHKVTWNGMEEDGRTAPAGEYTFLIDAKGFDGRKVAVKTDFSGRITGINYTASGPVLLIGKQSIRLSDVKKIIDPAMVSAEKRANAGKIKDDTAAAQKPAGTKTVVVKPASNTPDAVDPGAMGQLDMSADLQKRIAKEIGKDQG